MLEDEVKECWNVSS